jgi:quinol-cytochrome oxidoreductase complex cytochrome b subunit
MDPQLRRRNRRLAWALGVVAVLVALASAAFWMRLAEAIS